MPQHDSAREVSLIPGLLSQYGLTSTDEQVREWMSWVRTLETRARIRRWSKIETFGMVLMVTSVVLCLVDPFASIAVAVCSIVSDASHTGLHWWIWGVTFGALIMGVAVKFVADGRREAACFADGQVCEGIVDRAIEHPGSGDDHTWYDLRISAALPGGVTLRRRLHLEGERWNRRVGHRVRFCHNTLDPDAFDDVLLAGWPRTDGKRS